MSWLLGNHKPPQDFGQFQFPTVDGSGAAGGGPNDGSPPKKGINSQMDSYRFDSSALERAAAAAKELEKSSKDIPGIFCF
jgi:ATPase family AAA domain-containing protein 3A/B